MRYVKKKEKYSTYTGREEIIATIPEEAKH